MLIGVEVVVAEVVVEVAVVVVEVDFFFFTLFEQRNEIIKNTF